METIETIKKINGTITFKAIEDNGKDIEATVKTIISHWDNSGGFRTEFSCGVMAIGLSGDVEMYTTSIQPDYCVGKFYTRPEVDATSEDYELANKYYKKKDVERMDKTIESLNKDNLKLASYPAKGRVVRIIKGKGKGSEGVVFWVGNNNFGRSYSSRYESKNFVASTLKEIMKADGLSEANVDMDKDRFGFKDSEGNTFWANLDSLEVVNPENYLLPQESIIKQAEIVNKRYSSRYVDGELVKGQGLKNLDNLY